MQKFIFVTGGVCSGLGKGISAASIGLLLRKMGYSIFAQKLDPYLNIDPGTMNPIEHGEVFVTNDGAETDLDLGHYERFIDTPLSRDSSISSGQIYTELLKQERKGEYLGKTVQIIPHVTNAIKNKIKTTAEKSKADIIIIEIGGTVGDIEGEAFFESVRQLTVEMRPNVLNLHLTFLPYLKASKELKTKPTQNSIRELRRIGIEPDIILARADYKISQKEITKISNFANLPPEHVIPAVTAKHSIYEVPLKFEKYNISKIICDKLNIKHKKPDLTKWQDFVNNIIHAKQTLHIGIAGKYTGLSDAYYSVIESLDIAGAHLDTHIEIIWIDTEKLEQKNQESKDEKQKLKEIDGVIVPGGFGSRGINGKLAVARHARKNKLPYLGLCLGSQIISIDLAREHISPDASSQEFDPDTTTPIVHIMQNQKNIKTKGGTQRLGSYPCKLKTNSISHSLYETNEISERHRHRYEFNNKYKKQLEKQGLKIAGTSLDGELTEIVEITNHPFMIGTQFHPEFLSRPEHPHPLFKGFLKAAQNHKI